GEVARRLAHEIKNPLTPIQLSAERLEHKLSAKLEQADAEMLRRATNTIVSQVGAMTTMANAFSEYARAPAAHMEEIDLNYLIKDVLGLYESAGSSLKASLDPELPPLMGDPTLLRQVLHNLLKNAQDALDGRTAAVINISTVAKGTEIKLCVQDN